jgi:hypothetical protein
MSNRLPEWIRDADGTRALFEPEEISRDLFAAMEARGEPNSFLARELTDAVLFFLDQNAEAEIERAELAELVRKVVHELGHPDLADEYEALQQVPDASPRVDQVEVVEPLTPLLGAIRGREPPLELERVVSRSLLRDYSTRHVYPRDLLSAAEQRLIVLTDLESPLELASMNLHVSQETDLLAALLDGRQVVSERVVLFGIEKLGISPAQVQTALTRAGEITGLHLEVRLNHAETPAAVTGLFSSAPSEEAGPIDHRDWLTGLKPHSRLSIGWHLDESHLTPDTAERLLAAREVELIFPPSRPTPKAEAVLTSVGMNLGELFAQLGEKIDLDLYLKNLGTLTRLAKSVGYVRRKYLRKHAREAALRGFRLERARLRVVLTGLEEVARHLAGSAASSPSKWVEMQVKLLTTVRESLDRDRPGSLPSIVETVQTFETEPLTLSQQIRFGAQLQNAAGGHGTLRLRGEEGQRWQADSVAETLRRAWDAGIGRLALV